MAQNRGSVKTKAGRCIAFTNIYKHCVSPFKLVDPSRPGHRKILVFFLVASLNSFDHSIFHRRLALIPLNQINQPINMHQHLLVLLLLVMRAHDLVHTVVAQIIAAPTCRAEKEERFDKQEAQRWIRFALFSRWKELKGFGESFLVLST